MNERLESGDVAGVGVLVAAICGVMSIGFAGVAQAQGSEASEVGSETKTDSGVETERGDGNDVCVLGVATAGGKPKDRGAAKRAIYGFLKKQKLSAHRQSDVQKIRGGF